LLLRVDDGMYYALDDVGKMAWDLCDGATSLQQIAARLTEDFDAPESVIAADLVVLFDDLRDAELVVLD
jgi:hypothetical protein